MQEILAARNVIDWKSPEVLCAAPAPLAQETSS
jgi:hypothetical protein